MGSDKLKNQFSGSILIKKVEICVIKKVDGSWFFRSLFHRFCPKWVAIGFIEKQAPQKALCLGPDPPPENLCKFIDFYGFFTILGPSIEPEKASAKSASTPYPPWKVIFMAYLYIGELLFVFSTFLVWVVCGVLSFPLLFLVFRMMCYSSFSGC
jgi:hypothetical protein